MTSGFSWFFILAGLIGIAAGLLADLLGFGQYPGFGWKQILAICVGVALVIAGVLIGRGDSDATDSD